MKPRLQWYTRVCDDVSLQEKGVLAVVISQVKRFQKAKKLTTMRQGTRRTMKPEMAVGWGDDRLEDQRDVLLNYAELDIDIVWMSDEFVV